MGFLILPRNEISPNEWDALVEGSPDGWVFSLWSWQDMILTVEPWALEDYSFVFRDGRRLLAVVPLQYHPSSGRMASSGWGGSGPVIDSRLDQRTRDNLMGRAIRHCVELAQERKAFGFDVSLSPVTATSISCTWGVNHLAFYGLEDRSGLAQVVDLSLTEDDLWADLSPDARRQIKKARDAGLIAERVDWSQNLEHYYRLHVATYTRTKVQPHPLVYFAGIATQMAPSENSVLWAIHSPAGEALAYHNTARFGTGAYYHTGCSTEEARFIGASYLLFWEAMLGAKRAGIRWYDCGAIFPAMSSSEKQKGLSTFKTKFGGQPHRTFSAGVNFHCRDAAPAPNLPRRLANSLLFRLRALNQSVR